MQTGKRHKLLNLHFVTLVAIILFALSTFGFYSTFSAYEKSKKEQMELLKEKNKFLEQLDSISKELEEFKNKDFVKQNQELENLVKNLQDSYKKSISVYERLLDLKAKKKNTQEIDKNFSEGIFKLSQKDYIEANKTFDEVLAKIKEEEEKIALSFNIPKDVPQTNSPPQSGFSKQNVLVEGIGNFMVSIVAADLSNTKVIVDTASDSDCFNNCPVIPLAEYVSRNGAFAGINGTYFCPAEYPSCAGKTNTFDLLVMNHKKTYFNSANNIYSPNPGVIFGDSYIRFVSSIQEWGRDTSPNGVLSNFPLLVFNSEIRFGGDSDPKKGSKGGRSFVANKGNTVYIGVVHNATVAESARVLKSLGMENALNLDNGGSTALWFGGYKVGPGRNLPNAILFVRK